MLNDEGLALHLSRLPHDRPFTAAEASLEGVHAQALHALVAAGELRRPVRSAYVVAGLPDSLSLRLAVVSKIAVESSTLTDHTAAWLHAGDAALLPGSHSTIARPDVFRHPEKRGLRSEFVRSGKRGLLPSDLVEMGGFWVTTPLRTAADIGRLFSRDVALWGLDCMLATRTFTHEELSASVRRFRGMRGVVQLRALTPLADAGSQSFGESALRLRWYDAALPRPVCQLPVETGLGTFFLDLGDEAKRFGAEYDGELHHSGEQATRHDAERRAAIAAADHHVEVFTRHHVFGRQQNAADRLRAAYRAWCASVDPRPSRR